jgi:hypothetical protein
LQLKVVKRALSRKTIPERINTRAILVVVRQPTLHDS